MSRGASQAPCTHCGLPMQVPEDAGDDDPIFCCAGCEAVYHTLHSSGLQDFYDHQSSWSVDEPQPVDPDSLDADDVALFDTSTFLDEHTERLDDGTRQVSLHLQGVHCAGCVWLVERMPRLVDGVVDARLELARQRITLRWHPDQVKLSTAAHWLTQFGFQAHPIESGRVNQRYQAGQNMLVRVGICWAIAANVMLLTIAIYAGLDPVNDGALYHAVLWSTLALSAGSLVVGGSVFFRRAIANLKMRRLSMDVPISLGIAVGWGYSAFATVTGIGEVWFDSIVILIAALLTARYLQVRGNSMAADAAERLISLLPHSAHKIVDDATEIVPIETLETGDLIRVKAGDVIPADGRITDGQSQVSRAVLTGESRPESVTPGDLVEAGTTNLDSPLDLRVSATGTRTRVGRLMEWIEARDQRRAPIVQIADRLSSYFIAFVLLAAIGTAVAWAFIDPSRAVHNVVALLVIACPCALGMATPLALTVGTGRAAKRGIHIKHDDVIEALTKATDIVFDKTGTLTAGEFSVQQIRGDRKALLAACALETTSNHPIADALLNWAKNQGHHPADAQLDEVEEVPATGLKGRVDGQSIRIGRISWFDDLDEEQRRWATELARQGQTPLGVSVDGQLVTLLTVGDALRPEAADLLRDLRQRGLRIHLLSGDHRDVVHSVADALGIADERTRGAASPEEKREYLAALRLNHPDARIAMVGDGVNDAIALQDADIGIAVDGGAEASLVAADIFIVKPGVAPIAHLFKGTHHVMRVVHRNLMGSGLYNVFGISLAAMGFITPLAAAILMPISSLGVVTSSLVQRSFDKPAPTGDAQPHTTSPDRAAANPQPSPATPS